MCHKVLNTPLYYEQLLLLYFVHCKAFVGDFAKNIYCQVFETALLMSFNQKFTMGPN